MRVLFVTQRGLHGHSYASCAIYSGLRSLQREGFIAEVGCYPSAASWLHLRPHPDFPDTGLPAEGARDDCQIATDAAWSVPDSLSDRPDLIIGSTHALRELGEATSWSDVPIAVIDGDDIALNQAGAANEFLRGKSFHYFKRELPAGATWATALPFSYPGTRALSRVDNPRESAVVYYASDGEKRALSRIEVVDRLRRLCGDRAWVGLDDDKRRRPKPERVHDMMSRALVGVHWNPYAPAPPWSHGWDAIRFWENCAYGLATVGLRPWIEIPHPFTDGENVVWVDSPAAAADAVAELLNDPERAVCIGRAAHAHFMRYHTAEARVLWLMERCGFPTRELPAS